MFLFHGLGLYITSTSHSQIWGGMLESIQGMSDKCFRPCRKKNC